MLRRQHGAPVGVGKHHIGVIVPHHFLKHPGYKALKHSPFVPHLRQFTARPQNAGFYAFWQKCIRPQTHPADITTHKFRRQLITVIHQQQFAVEVIEKHGVHFKHKGVRV